jgi:ribonucleoside-diphosphate reductase alpha chain
VIQFASRATTTSTSRSTTPTGIREAYLTVSGQNSNNSVRVTDEFLKAVESDGDWDLTRTRGNKIAKTVKARDLWEKIGYAAWACADPGLQFHTTVNDWHTCPASGPIRASQSVLGIHVPRRHRLQSGVDEPAHLPHTKTGTFNVDSYEHAVRLWTVVLEISVHDGAVPSQRDRAALLRIPHARPGLRQSRRPA